MSLPGVLLIFPHFSAWKKNWTLVAGILAMAPKGVDAM